MMRLAVLFALVLAPSHAVSNDRALLVSEHASYSVKDGVIELRGGRGWLRSRQVYLDFQVAFEYRATRPDTDAALVLRTWTGQGQWPDRGYRLTLPVGAAQRPAVLLTGRREDVTVVQEGRVDLRDTDEWQTMEVTGQLRRVTVMLNGAPAGSFDIESFGGFLMFENRKGRIELRNLTMRALEARFPNVDTPVPSKELKKLQGRMPKLLREVKPVYTPDAMRRKIQGHVQLEAVVLPDGTVGDVRVTRALDEHLDACALAAVRGWHFEPGVVNGRAVPVLVEIDMSFTLK